MDRNEAKQAIKERISCTLYLIKSKNGLYCCPFCGSGTGRNGTGALKLYDTNTWTCHSCKKSGDVIDLYQKINGVDYAEALKELAESAGVEIDPYRQESPQRTRKAPQNGNRSADRGKPADSPKSPQRATGGAEDTANDYSQYYMECAERIEDPAAVSYLKARGINLDTAIACGIGYDPAWISPTTRRNQRAKGKDWLPEPTARIIIPTTESHYIARAINPDVKQYAKMNEGKPGIFNAGVVYDDKYESVFVTEGAFDALSIIEMGAAAVALNSTSNVKLFLKQLEAKPTRAALILCLDNDDQGKKAAAELKQGLVDLGIDYATADICGEYKDPNEALTGDREKFFSAVWDAAEAAKRKPDNMRDYIDNWLISDISALETAKDIKTGFEELDEKSGGLNPGFYVIAAISSLGKTTLAVQIADNLAAAGRDVLFFSLEMSRLEILTKSFARILAQEDPESKITSLALRKGFYKDKLKAAAELYKEKGIADHLSVIEGNFNCTITFIRAYVYDYIRRTNARPIVFIDYLQIMQPTDEMKGKGAREVIDSNVTELKRISRDYGITVFAVSSVNRANYLTPIDFESLKESGAIEFTADAVWGLQLQCLTQNPIFEAQNKIKEKRETIKAAKAETPRKIELVCLKNRYGVATFSCNFNYYPATDLFVGADKEGFYKSYGADPTTGILKDDAEITAEI